ncbi:MAG: diguanylate cyclase [Deltaproteobacteria bacterium]|nr:diguanylate cyclase [Deltaproteobacteria bacterium]
MRQLRVLVVDDDADIRNLIQAALQKDYEVMTAADGAAALEVLRTQPVDCVVADHMMPGITGVNLLTATRDVQPKAVRILVTASERVEDLRDAVNLAHVHRFISKPLRVMDLRALVAEAVRANLLEEENARLVVELREKNDMLARALSAVQEQERRLERQVEERTRELRAANAELEQLALRDGLTGLYNHRFFQEALTQELARGARYHTPVGLVFLDVDHFKNYNDMLGHPAGDKLLKDLARILCNTGEIPEISFRGRMGDIPARYGGEEFVIVLPQTPKDGTIVRAERLREAVASFPFPGGNVQPGGRVTISVGVAAFPDDAINKQQLIECADQMVYLAKRSGRDQVRVWGRDRPLTTTAR